MITNLHVKNLALIDEADVEFGPGLNILTGETGAGKSILLGSINLALGKKISREMIREGEDSCLVELVFSVEDAETLEKLAEAEIEPEDGQLIITRRVRGGKSISRINGETCTVAKIKAAAELLLDIHGQHEHQSLLYPEKQLEILDAYGRHEIQPHIGLVAKLYREYQQLAKEWKGFLTDETERARELSFLEYEAAEIRNAQLKEGEEEELEQRFRRMDNAKRIAESLNQVYQLTGGGNGACDQVGRALSELAGIAEFDPALSGMERTLADVEGILNDLSREMSGYMEDFTFAPEELREVEERLDCIRNIKAKYGRTTALVLENLQKKEQRIEELKHFEERKAALKGRLKQVRDALNTASLALSNSRKAVGAELAEKIRQGLLDLNFQEVAFEIRFERKEAFGANGFDRIEFLISANAGEPVRPMNRIASGGELSRIMLAIKTLLADKDHTETLIFDEIDTGISGRTAQKVSEKMATIAAGHQVLCITHLAQIAAMADQHYEIRKHTEAGVTATEIRRLTENESVEELARILGGAEITDAVRGTAAEMKRLAGEKKQK